MFSGFNSSDIKCAVWKSKDYPNGVDLKKIIYNGAMVWHAHVWGAATCTKPQTCSVCGATTGSALGHKYVGTVITTPTCTSDGITRYTCSLCGSSYEETTAATGHSWNAPTYVWTTYNQCVATRTCKNDSTHPQTSTATYAAGHITSDITTAPTCTESGVRTYTATFPDSWAGTSTTTETVAASGHNWYEPTYSWTGYTACAATLTCKSDTSHVEIISATRITSEITTPATYDAPGVRTYTAIFPIVDGLTNQTKTEEIPKLEKLKFTLNSDGTGYTVQAAATDITGEIDIPSTYNGLPVESIPYRGFYNCTGITNLDITVPNLIIEKEAFTNCTNLTFAYLELYSIGELAFSNCSNLDEVDLDTCSVIGYNAFDQCTNLTSIYVYSDYWRLKSSDSSDETYKLIDTRSGNAADVMTSSDNANYKWYPISTPSVPVISCYLYNETQVHASFANTNSFQLRVCYSMVFDSSTTVSGSKNVSGNSSTFDIRGPGGTFSSCTITAYFADAPSLSTSLTIAGVDAEESSSTTV